MTYQLIGFLGIMLINIAYIPQTIKTYRTKNVEGLSATFFATMLLGVCLLQIYSISIWDVVYVSSNTVAICNIVLLLILIKMYQNNVDGLTKEAREELVKSLDNARHGRLLTYEQVFGEKPPKGT